ncbi:MAG: beta-galactosidase [Treponema sp.]|nr:beta-galactosidase [Treponema sp.]
MKTVKKSPPIVAKFPHFIHGGDYNPDQWLKWKDEIWKEDFRLARLAGINSFSVGIFSWTALEPEEGKYTFDWLDRVMDLLAENKMTAVLATPSGARPAWMSRKYPEVLRINAMRQKNLHGARHNHCMSSPVYREKVREINTALAERYKKHPALGVWHISNEYGGECHCPRCQEKFRAWVRERYRTLDNLNDAWWTTFWSHIYTDWSQVESPSPLGETNIHGLNLDWKRFTTEQHVDFYLHEIAPLKKITPNIPCTTNLMGTYPGIDYFRLAEVMDVVSWDNYPQWTGTDKDADIAVLASFKHDLTRGLKGKPFMLMESSPSATNWRPVAKLHRPGVHMLQSMQAVAHGSDTVQYFQIRKGRGSSEKFHGALIDHEGTEKPRVFKEIAEVGKRLKTMDAIIGTNTPSSAAIVYDWNIRWAVDDAKGFLQTNTNYEQTVVDHYSAFWQLGIPVDIIDSTKKLDGYDLVVAPMLYMLRPGFAEALDAFVKKGGTLVTTYITGYVDQSDLCFRGGFPGPLRKCLGIWAEEIDALYPDDSNSIKWKGKSYKAFDFCELIHAETAKPAGTYGSDFYKGQPALTVNNYGKGKACHIAARTGRDFLLDYYKDLTESLGIQTAVKKLPHGVTAQVRSDGKTDYVFVMNFTPGKQIVDTGSTGQKVSGKWELDPWECWIYERESRNEK